MKESREEVSIYLKRKLDPHYLVLYIDATFIDIRRDKSVSKEDFILF
ncbi:transposase-like protein [Flavobacterium sp. PL11]|jgi:putative transposase|nr:transposase-like protein [Flavobacterium sp. PL11]